MTPDEFFNGFDASQYDGAMIARLSAQIQALLASICDDIEAPLGNLNILPTEQRQQEAIQARMDAEDAKSSVPDLPPVLKEQYGFNIELGKDLEQLTNDNARTVRDLNRLQSELKELGEELGLSGERVRQLQQEALAWLRHPAHSWRLRQLLGRNRAADYRRALAQNAALRRSWRKKR